MDCTRLTKNAPPTPPISWRSWSRQRPKTQAKMLCWTTRSRAHTANNSPCRRWERQIGKWRRIGSMGSCKTPCAPTIAQADWLQQADGRYTPRSIHIPRDDVDMEEQRSRNGCENKVRKVPRTTHPQSHQSRRGPQCHESSPGNPAARIAACLGSRRSRGTTYKPRRSTTAPTEPLPTLRRVGPQYFSTTLAQFLRTPGLTTSAQPPVRAYWLYTVIAQRCIPHVTTDTITARLRRFDWRGLFSKDRPSYLYRRDHGTRSSNSAHGWRPFDLVSTN